MTIILKDLFAEERFETTIESKKIPRQYMKYETNYYEFILTSEL